jgi:hypothetical protein
MTGVKGYSITRDNNTEYMPEQQTPGSVNNGARQIQKDIRDWYNDAEWIEYGKGDGSGSGSSDYSITYVTAQEFTIEGGDLTTAYAVGRGIKATGDTTGTIYGFISASSYSTVTTVTVDWSQDELVNEQGVRVWLSTLSPDGASFPIAAIQGRPIDHEDAVISRPTFKDYAEKRQTLTSSSGAVAWDLTAGNVAYLKLTESITALTVTGWAPNPDLGSATLIVQQNGTGGYTFSGWPAVVKWLGNVAPTITSTAWGADVVVLTSIDSGASVIGNYGQGALFSAAIG